MKIAYFLILFRQVGGILTLGYSNLEAAEELCSRNNGSEAAEKPREAVAEIEICGRPALDSEVISKFDWDFVCSEMKITYYWQDCLNGIAYECARVHCTQRQKITMNYFDSLLASTGLQQCKREYQLMRAAHDQNARIRDTKRFVNQHQPSYNLRNSKAATTGVVGVLLLISAAINMYL